MHPMRSFYRVMALGAAVVFCLLLSLVRVRAEEKASASVEALLYSTMPSTTAHRPEMAMDSDPSTYFKSAYGMDDGDTFLILFSRPIPVQSFRIVTGNAENQNIVTDGLVETSPDAVQFSKAAAFDKTGIADATLGGKPVQALCIRVERGHSLPALLVREITIQSPVKIAHIQLGPGRGFTDISQAPDVADWAQRAEQQMESFWADAAALLYSYQFITPNMVNVVYRTGPDVTPVAATGGGVMTVNSQWCRQHPEDTGLTVHEMAHVVQASSAYNPVWLVEGVADYIRWIKFEPQNYHPRIDTRTATYHDSYRTTGAFLGWCELHYDSRLVTKLNHDVRFGTYTNARFKQYCGKDVDTLWAEFVTAYQTDLPHLLEAPIPPADRPRILPAVKAGSSVPVDLSANFNTKGFCTDGKTAGAANSLDGEGNSYSANLLVAMPTEKEVAFHLGRPDTANVVSCDGKEVRLPAGKYASLWLLGTGIEGSQMRQNFVVNYADGTKATLSQNFSDWFLPQDFPGESHAVKMAYRNMANGEKDTRPFYVYRYGFALDSAKTVKSLILPDNAGVMILAISLAN